jgi:hypothetical protein
MLISNHGFAFGNAASPLVWDDVIQAAEQRFDRNGNASAAYLIVAP